MSREWRVSLTQPQWLLGWTLHCPTGDGPGAVDGEWFDTEDDARAHLRLLIATYKNLSYSLRRFDAFESRAGEGTLVDQGTI